MSKPVAWLSAFALAGLLGHPAGAQPAPPPPAATPVPAATPAPPVAPTPAGAAALQAQIQAAVQNASAAKASLPNPVAQVTAEGDYYRLRVPLVPLFKEISPADAAFTAKLRPLAGGVWSVEDQQYPPEFEVITKETPPTPRGAPAAAQSATYDIKLGAQDVHGSFDASGATGSNTSGTVASIDIAKSGGNGAALTHLGMMTVQSNVTPTVLGRVDMTSNADVDGYAGQFVSPDGIRAELNAARLHVANTATGVSPQAVANLWRALLDLSAAGSKAPSGPDMTPVQKAQLRQFVLATRDLLKGATVQEEAETVRFDVAGGSGSLAKVALTLSAAAPQDMLSGAFGISLDGLALASLPPPFGTYVPSHIAFRPTFANISVPDLTKLALDSLTPLPSPAARLPAKPGAPARPQPAQPAQPSPDLADAAALFSHGGIQFGFDQFEVDLVDTHLTGTGSFTMTGPQSVTGSAELTAHGLDALLTRLQADPLMAQAVPALLLLKGIAKTNGDAAVWQVTVNDQKVLVNGLDLSAMAGGFK